jgi:uncharacterized protein (TIGR02246 family)
MKRNAEGKEVMAEATALPDDTVEDCLGRIRSAWNAGDAHGFADAFTEDATYVIFLGEALIGREEILANHVDVFAKWQKGTRMEIKAIRNRPIGEDVAIVLTAGGIGKDVVAYDKLQTFTLVRRAGRWLCAAFHNTAMSKDAMRFYNRG